MKRYFLLLTLPLVVLAGQNQFSTLERLQGYAQRGDTAWFIFDEQVYGRQPSRVVLEGAMRDWEHDMNAPDWWLNKSGQKGLWLMKLENPGFKRIPPGTPFKFRIDEGEWLSPPETAPNVKSGNLIFLHDVKALSIVAEMNSPRDVRLIFKEAKPDYIYDPRAYTLTSFSGRIIPVSRVFYTAPGQLQVVPAGDLDLRRLHFITTPYSDEKITVRYDGWFRHLYSDAELGANFIKEENATYIRLFAPRADSIQLFLYLKPGQDASSVTTMEAIGNGVWQARFQGNWEGWYYDFRAFGPDEPGNHFFQTIKQNFTDPWGRVSVDTFGPCRIWPKMTPASPLKNGIPDLQDVIAYEVHVQDFTRNLPLPDSLKGTFRGFAARHLKNKMGQPVGFDHLLELGINAVHLMPVQEFLHFPDDEWRAAFEKDPYMIAQGINMENYQWGYRTSHAFALESRYRVKGSEWGSQNRDFRDLVQAFHDAGIAVIVDVVFNHTAERMDNRQYYFNFSAIDVPYFYRTNDQFDYIGEYGTETKSEERPMMQRWIIEQCTDLVDQYGIDGFRIDIAGQTDEQTLKALRTALGPDKIVYGEPWIASADPDYENNPDWDWYKADAPITFFQDDARNAFKGPTSNPVDKWRDRGYAGGNADRESVKKALSAGFPEDHTPLSGINYLDIHDNWALADRFARADWDGRRGVDEARFKIAATLLFTSLGPIVLHGGTELMRSKASAPLQEIVKYTRTGPIYIHGKRDTYNLARANEFIWEHKGLNTAEHEGINCNYRNMFDFWKGLISLRRSRHGRVFRIAQKAEAGYYRWIEPENTRLLGYVAGQSVLVLLNTDSLEGTFDFIWPSGDWRLIGDTDRIVYPEGLTGEPQALMIGEKKQKIQLPAESLMIWVNMDK